MFVHGNINISIKDLSTITCSEPLCSFYSSLLTLPIWISCEVIVQDQPIPPGKVERLPATSYSNGDNLDSGDFSAEQMALYKVMHSQLAAKRKVSTVAEDEGVSILILKGCFHSQLILQPSGGRTEV